MGWSELVYTVNGVVVSHIINGVEQLVPNKPPPWTMDSNGRLVYTNSGDRPWEPKLTPGAGLAKQKGCTCSRLDNDFGHGKPIITEAEGAWVDTEFVITSDCPLHDVGQRNENQRDDGESVNGS